MTHVNRPKSSEDVEDLEREQEKFLASHSRTSVTLQKRTAQESGDGPEAGSGEPRRKSRFRRQRDEERAQINPAADVPPTGPVLRDLVVSHFLSTIPHVQESSA